MNNTELKSNIRSGVFWKFAEKFASKGVSFIVSLVLARLLSPDDYGVVAMINIFISIADVLVTGGLSSALIQKKDATEKEYSTVFYCNFFLSTILYIILFFSAPFISAFYEMPSLTPVIRIFGLRVFPSAYQAIQVAYVSSRMEFKKFFYATLGGTLASGVVGIVMAITGFGVWALIAQSLLNIVVNTIILMFTVKWKPILYFNFRESANMIKFGCSVMGSQFIGQIFNQLNSFVIGKKYTSSDLAYYDKGKSFPRLIVDNITSAVQDVLFPGMANASDVETVKLIARKSTRYLSYIIFPLMFGMAAVASPMITVLLTDKWIEAAPYVRIICIEGVIGVMDSANGSQVLKACGYADRILKLEFIKKPLALIILLISMNFGLLGIVISVPVTAFTSMVINTFAASKVTGYGLCDQFLDAFPALWMSIAMFLAVSVIDALNFNIYTKLIAEIVIGFSIYLFLSKVSRNKEFRDVVHMIESITNRFKQK